MALPLPNGSLVPANMERKIEQFRAWKGLCDMGEELEHDTHRPALQTLYFEAIESWLNCYMSVKTGGERWDTRGSRSSASRSSRRTS